MSIGTHPPAPSLEYPFGQTVGTDIEVGTQDPLPLLWYPELQITGTLVGTQFPYLSALYPDGQLTVIGGFFWSVGTQLPSLEWNPDAHDTELVGGRQFPKPSVEKPGGQSGENGFGIISGTHYELLSLWKPELHPEAGGTTGEVGV